MSLSKLKRTTAAVLFVSGIVLGPNGHATTTAQLSGKLTGVVMDAHGALILTPRPTIIVEGNGITRSVEPDEEGQFTIDLPNGIYQISAELGGYYPFRRAAFRITSGTTIVINLVPTPRYLVRGTTVSLTNSPEILVPRPKYDRFSVSKSQDKLLQLLVQYKTKDVTRSIINYGGATLSYDTLTIYAARIRLYRKSRRIEASGERVVVENGKERREVQSIEVRFDDGRPVIKPGG